MGESNRFNIYMRMRARNPKTTKTTFTTFTTFTTVPQKPPQKD